MLLSRFDKTNANRSHRREMPLKDRKLPSKLCMGTFRKFLFIRYSRRPRGKLLVNEKKMGITDQKILFYSATVKEKIALVILGFICLYY